MKKIISILTIIFVAQLSFSQQEKVSEDVLLERLDSISDVVFKVIGEDIDAARSLIDEMMRYSIMHDYEKGKGMSYGTYGILYGYMGNQGKSIEYFIKAANIFESIGSETLAATSYSNVGILLIEERQFEEAKLYIKKSLDYFLKTGKGKGYIDYSGLGLISIKTNEGFDEAMLNLNKAEELATKKKDTIRLATILCLQGSAHTKFNQNLTNGIALIRKALLLNKIKQPNDHYSLGRNYFYLGEAYWKKKDYAKALMYNDSSLVHYKLLNYFKGLRLAYENRKEIFAGQGKYKKGFEAFELFNKHKDSLFQKDKMNQLVRVKTKYETDQIIAQKETAETKVKLTEAISKQNRNYFISALIIGLLILLISIFYFSRLKARKKMELITLELSETQKRLAIEKQYRDSELKALKSQMNPHFIFNALNSIQEYIVLNKKNLASDYLGKFADLIRTYLDHSDTGNITIQEEVDSLNLYLDLEKLRFENQLDYSIVVDESINSEIITIPTMLVQPYVENALKHGLLHKKTDRKLNITFKKMSDLSIECCIEDNGVGRKKSEEINKKKIKTHKSFALKATGSRLDLLNYKKGNKIGVKTIDLFEEDQPRGTKVILNIPFKKEG